MSTHVSPGSGRLVPRSARPAVPDADGWPDVARVPRSSAVRTAVTRLVVRRALAALPLRVALAGGAPTGAAGPLLRVHAPDAFFARLGADGLIGFGESYLAGEWDSDDLVGVLTVLAANVATLVPPSLQRLRGLWAHRQPAAHRNTVDGAQGNIRRHYDLSNDMFALFLDETMTYSAALFPAFPARHEGARRRAAPQDRPVAGPRRGDRRDPAAGDRHRLGRAGAAGGGARRAGADGDAVAGAARPGGPPDRRGGVRRPGDRRAARLPAGRAGRTTPW